MRGHRSRVRGDGGLRMHRSGSDPDSDRAHWYMSNSDDESFVDKDKDCRRGTVAPLLKKGPWTSLENSILEKYIKKHGERNWKLVQKNTGLLRCGKSCRRTDNEIKNYWNTRIKKCKNNRWLLYPANVCNDALNEDQYGSVDPSVREKLTNNQLEDTTSMYSAPQFSYASISNILDRRLASKDYDSIEDQRNRIEIAAEYEISLPVLKTTNNDIFPSASIFANHGISNGNLSALSTTDALQMELPLIQFDPNNQFIYSRDYAMHLTNLALLNDQSEELLNHIDVLNYVVMKEELSGGTHTSMTPSSELVVPRYEGDVPPLQDDFTPYLYLNGANLSIFEDIKSHCGFENVANLGVVADSLKLCESESMR
uniref:Uncharacterized protein n=1 Tax=Oryza barthii TaxID=65489 RepID=A0A0D3ELA6_9ORYZ